MPGARHSPGRPADPQAALTMAVAERYIKEEERKRQLRRQGIQKGVVIAATGFVLPPILMLSVWLVFTVFNVMPLARSRLWVMLTPDLQELFGTLVLLTLFALPYLLQGGNAARKLADRGKRRQRAEWRVGGCFVGLTLATVLVFFFIVPFDSTWVHPGLGVPMRVLAIYYGLAIVLGGLGGVFGYDIGKRFVTKRRARSRHA